MKAREWQRFLDAQRRQHGKTLFTVTELANVAGASLSVIKVELGRLVRQGVMVRYAQGHYGLPDAVRPEALVAGIDAHAYFTGAYALSRHGMVTQVPSEITCFTNRRHNRSRVRETPVGRFVLVCVGPRLYRPPSEKQIAGPAQALCDFAYLARRRGTDPRALATFRHLDLIPCEELRITASRYPGTVRRLVCDILRRGAFG